MPVVRVDVLMELEEGHCMCIWGTWRDPPSESSWWSVSVVDRSTHVSTLEKAYREQMVQE
jgi:hypothetical protein